MSNLDHFDPNGPGIQDQLFGLPFTVEDASLVIVPVPWEPTVTFHTGTSHAPQAILKASQQIDLFNRDLPDFWKTPMAMMPIPQAIQSESDRLRNLVLQYRKNPGTENPILEKINEGCENLNVFVETQTTNLLQQHKLVGLVGGDHSTPLGFIRSLAKRYPSFGILQIDAHADLRNRYEGLAYAHASIMFNALRLKEVKKLVQVGIRDLCEEEFNLIRSNPERIKTFFDEDLWKRSDKGEPWISICKDLTDSLPDFIYVSLDVDGLNPSLCPSTGTPVPGGLSFYQVTSLLDAIAKSGKKVIGFDLNETGHNPASDWDAIVSSRLLWSLCACQIQARPK